MAAAAPPVPPSAPAPAPTPIIAAPMPAPAPVIEQPVVRQPTAPVAATPAPMPAPQPPAAPLQGNIATAQSGKVPYSDIKSPPFSGNLQVAVIQFGRGSTGLGGTDYSVLQKVAEIQKSNRATVRIVAHSAQDAYGSSVSDLARANYEVSRRRALAVANQLVQLGVPADRIVAEAASDAEPVYETNTARGIAANRRAEIFVDF
jgi:outer membrane protein OmpA-like peptidoglycan-associated protein